MRQCQLAVRAGRTAKEEELLHTEADGRGKGEGRPGLQGLEGDHRMGRNNGNVYGAKVQD